MKTLECYWCRRHIYHEDFAQHVRSGHTFPDERKQRTTESQTAGQEQAPAPGRGSQETGS